MRPVFDLAASRHRAGFNALVFRVVLQVAGVDLLLSLAKAASNLLCVALYSASASFRTQGSSTGEVLKMCWRGHRAASQVGLGLARMSIDTAAVWDVPICSAWLSLCRSSFPVARLRMRRPGPRNCVSNRRFEGLRRLWAIPILSRSTIIASRCKRNSCRG
jgi:hypothetical protein